MNNDSLKKYYVNKIKLFQKYNKLYYIKSKPSVSDSKFDELKKEILGLEKKYSFLNSKESPSVLVGFKPSKNFKK